MKAGWGIPNNYGGENPNELIEIAVKAEALGFGSVWVREHLFHATYVAERLGELGMAKGEIDDGSEETDLVASVVAHAVDFIREEWPLLSQSTQRVRELDFTAAVAGRFRQRREDVGREDIAADDREVRWCLSW